MKTKNPRSKKLKSLKNTPEYGVVANGLTEAILGLNTPWGQPGYSSALSQVDTLYKNERWYLISNQRQILSQMYVEHGIVQTIVDVPVDDGLRGGVEIKSKQLAASDIELLCTEMERENDLIVFGQGVKWTRLFGGGAVIILTDQDPKTPLNVNAIKEDSKLAFRAVDMWELYWAQQNIDDTQLQLSTARTSPDDEFYNYYGLKIHKTRVLRMKGLEAPSFVRPRLRGWGFSICEALVRSINQYLKSTDLVFEVLDEFKIDVYKIKDLASTLLQANGTNRIRERVRLANAEKNYQHAVTMDAEDDFIQKELTFSGLAETMAGIRMQIASDMRMPLTKIFGISSAGFNSGEDDIENYNSMVESQVRQKAKYGILQVVQLRSQKLFGYVPEDLSISFKPLRILSAEQEETVKTSKFNRVHQARQSGEITSKEFRDACNRDNLLPIQLSTSSGALEEIEEDVETEEPKEEKE